MTAPQLASGRLGALTVSHLWYPDTGVTVFYAGPHGARASVDVRGGGPGTRETDLLEPHNTVEHVHAVVLAGGSAFGLAAADGVMRTLAEHEIGFAVFGPDLPGPRVPIVPAAVIFDLLVGPTTPSADDGAAAAAAALEHAAAPQPAPSEALAGPVGSIGAGAGATAGRLRGGYGHHLLTVELPNTDSAAAPLRYQVAAGVVANPVGEVVDYASGELFAHGATGFPAVDPQALAAIPTIPERIGSLLNTTIGVVWTDAPLSKAQCKRLALAAHDGLARAVRPAHGPLDGDSFFGLATPAPQDEHQLSDPVQFAALCAAAADAVEGAIVSAVTAATSSLGWPSLNSLPARPQP